MHTHPWHLARRLALSLLASLAGMTAHFSLVHSATPPVKTAHRCTSPQGAVTYSQQPCATGSESRVLQAQDDRTDAQRQEAVDATQRDKAWLQQNQRAQQDAAHAAQQHPNSLSGKVRQVSVGQREVDRRGVSAEPLKHNARQFRAKSPRKAARSASSAS